MNSERKENLENEIKSSTFVENHEEATSIEKGVSTPDVVVEDTPSKDVVIDSAKVKLDKKPTFNEKVGLGYEVDDTYENFDNISDYSSSNTWRKALQDKKSA